MVFFGGDVIACLREPTLKELPKKLVRFDDDDAALRAHGGSSTRGVASDVRRDADPPPIRNARPYGNMHARTLPCDNRHKDPPM